jgi:hypothetical protein
LPPGVSCTAQVRPDFKSAKGAALTGTTRFKFNTGGPFVQSTRPYSGHRIDEEQFFTLRLNGDATLASVKANVWCAVEGLGERVPVRLIEGSDRDALLKAQGLNDTAKRAPLSVVTLACNRRPTPSAKVQLVFGKGVATPSGVANAVENRFDFQVREPFSASFSCERENAQSACLPLRPMRLQFNAPVTRKLAEAIRLKSDQATFQPNLGDADSGDNAEVTSLSFEPLFPEQASMTLSLPSGFQDTSGRSLRNADSFPLSVRTGAMPPLAKFAASPFGIVERFAEPSGIALLPVTLRNVEASLSVKGLDISPGQVSDLQPKTDADIIAWFAKIRRFDDFTVSRRLAASQVKGPLPPMLDAHNKNDVQTRMLSLLHGQPGVKALDLPKPISNDPRPFEVVGIPLSPGFHVIEVSSQRLGHSLLDERLGKARTMYVRTSALVTNLGVHFKLGRENSLAWVTTLDKGQPVANAKVQVSDCHGKPVASATTNPQGLAQFSDIRPEAPQCRSENYSSQAYFVSARAKDAGADDMAFTWSDWNRGIEPWRFEVPTSNSAERDELAHTVFDRTLLRAGETVSMKHLLRSQTGKGFGLADTQPRALVITHVGSGQQYTQALA